jgi:hypothetical protein
MDNKIKPLEVYTVINLNNVRSEKYYIVEEEVENNLQWGEEYVALELLHIAETYQYPTFKDLPIYKPKNDQR